MTHPKILVIDNYDSFTYNLVQILGSLASESFDLEVVRNDQIDLEGVKVLNPSLVIVSPGPGRPEHAGISLELMADSSLSIPKLGVCLGHQALASAFGGQVVLAERLLHGKTSAIYHDGRGVFQGLANPFLATRYHSLVVEEKSLPQDLEITAWTSHGEIMGLRHKSRPLEGVQFHPESLDTPEGTRLLKNFLDSA